MKSSVLAVLLASLICRISYASEPCYVHAHISKEKHTALFDELTEAQSLANRTGSQVSVVKSSDGQQLYRVNYTVDVAVSNLPDDCED